MSQSCKTERETCGKDCVSDDVNHTMNRICLRMVIIVIYCIFVSFLSSFLAIVIGGIGDGCGVQFASWPHFGGCSCHCGSSMDGICCNEEGRGSCMFALFLSTNP